VKRTSLVLAMALGLMMLTLCYSAQAQTQAVSLQCTMGRAQFNPAGTYNILIEADMSAATVTMPDGTTNANLYFKPGAYHGICPDYVESTSAMYRFGCSCADVWSGRQYKIDRISGEITFGRQTGEVWQKGTCTKAEIHQKF